MSEEANTPVYQDDIRQTQLAPNLNKLYLKAESAMEVRNWSYAISLLQAVLAKEPGFLEGRKRLRLASVKENEGKRGLKMGGESLKVMKLQTQVKKDPVKVIEALEKEVLATDPYNAQGNELLYEAASGAGLLSTAGFALETVISGDPENIKFYHKLGDFYASRNIYA